MKRSAVLLAACILSPWLAETAQAQQCRSEIDDVAKLLAARDAGAGPTTGMAPTANTGQAQTGDTPQQHPPTGRMGQAVPGGAASPQDVQGQTRGEPTAAEKAQGARNPQAEKLASAQAALERARQFERTGNNAECMSAVAEAKRLAQ